jgi:hypothetical protein
MYEFVIDRDFNRRDRMWTMPLGALETLSKARRASLQHRLPAERQKKLAGRSYSARVHRRAYATHRKVMSLHARMGHASSQVMCHAIKSKAWINCGLDPGDIISTFKKHPCLWCVLGKRNEAPPIKSVSPFSSGTSLRISEGDVSAVQSPEGVTSRSQEGALTQLTEEGDASTDPITKKKYKQDNAFRLMI